MRKKPYTVTGISRLRCFRAGCKNKAEQQWNACSDDNQWRPICNECDIELNTVVLQFMGFKNWHDKIEKYKLRFK